MDLRGVVDGDPGKVLGGIAPPLSVLRPVAVTTRLGLGGEADHGDAPAVLGDPRGGTEPTVGVGGELSLPAAQIPADPGWVGRPALNDLNEHELLSLSAMSLSSIPSPLHQRVVSAPAGLEGGSARRGMCQCARPVTWTSGRRSRAGRTGWRGC